MANTLQYKKQYNKMLVDHGKQGRSYSTFAAVVGVSRETLYDWEEKFPAFKVAKQKAKMNAQDFWEKLLVLKGTGQNKNIDMTAVIFTLKTRFHHDYGEKQKIIHDVTSTANNTITLAYNLTDDESGK